LKNEDRKKKNGGRGGYNGKNVKNGGGRKDKR
jgi:hypothetical protein